MREFIDIVEAIYYQGEFRPYGTASEIKIIKDPSRRELDAMLAKSTKDHPGIVPELRGILNADGLYVWDGYDGEHASVSRTFGIKGLGIYVYRDKWRFEDYYLRHPDLREEAIELLQNPSITRAFGETDFSQEGCQFPR